MSTPRTNDLPLVSILVVNYNGSAFLGDCLDSLRGVAYPRYEVVVVDNGSVDDSRALLARYPWVRSVPSDRNLGFAGGNNLGLRHCLGELILLLNSDTVVRPDFLTPLVEHMEAEPLVGVVQGKMVAPRLGGVLDVCGSYLTPIGFPYHRGYLKPDGPLYAGHYPMFCGKGACLLIRRSAIEAAGGFLFDDSYFCYYEESDFCHRVWMSGGEVRFVAGPPIQHLMGATSGRMPMSEFALRHYLRNQTFTLCGNLEWSTLLRVMPLYFAVLVASLAMHAVRGQWGAVCAHLEALAVPYTERLRILARRKLIARIRTVSDESFWMKISCWPGFGYFLKTAQGRLAEHVDEVRKRA